MDFKLADTLQMVLTLSGFFVLIGYSLKAFLDWKKIKSKQELNFKLVEKLNNVSELNSFLANRAVHFFQH